MERRKKGISKRSNETRIKIKKKVLPFDREEDFQLYVSGVIESGKVFLMSSVSILSLLQGAISQ